MDLAERFPRLTLCKFQIYVLHSQQTHWLQCLLATNVYIEKIFAIIWVWLWILAFLILIDLVLCLPLIIAPSWSLKYELKSFTRKFSLSIPISADLALLLSLIKSNSNVYTLLNIVEKLELPDDPETKLEEEKKAV